MKKHLFTFFDSRNFKIFLTAVLLLGAGLYFKSVFKIPVAHATMPFVKITLTAPVNTNPDSNLNSSSDPQWIGPVGSAPFQAYPYAPIISYSWQILNGGPVVSAEAFADGVDIGPLGTDNPSHYQSYIPGSAAGAHTTYVQVKQDDGSTWQSNTITFYSIKPPAYAVVTSSYSGASWTFIGTGTNPGDLCTLAACSGNVMQKYQFFANNATVKVTGSHVFYKLDPTISSQVYSLGKVNNFLAKLINSAEASTCGSDTCTGVNDGDTIGFSVNYSDPSPGLNPTYFCTIDVVGTWNGQYSKATGAPFSISGPQPINGTDSNGYESYQALTDPSARGANYTFSSPSTQATVNGYASTSTTVSQSGACTSGGTLTFTLNSQSNPIIDVH